MRAGTPYSEALFQLGSGIAEYLCGHWKKAVRTLADAEDLFANRCTGAQWELNHSRFCGLWATWMIGDVQRITERWSALARDAEDRRDAMASTFYNGLIGPLHCCGIDDPTAASALIDQARGKSLQASVDLVRLLGVLAAVNVAMYLGDTAKAWREIDGAWDFLKRSPVFRLQMMRITLLELRARAALGASGEAVGDRRRLYDVASRCAKAIAREKAPWGAGVVHLVRAGLHARFGNIAASTLELVAAEQAFERADMGLWQACSMHARGRLATGSDAQTLIDVATGRMVTMGIRNPTAMAAMFVP
jgi:hypothetical protein